MAHLILAEFYVILQPSSTGKLTWAMLLKRVIFTGSKWHLMHIFRLTFLFLAIECAGT